MIPLFNEETEIGEEQHSSKGLRTGGSTESMVARSPFPAEPPGRPEKGAAGRIEMKRRGGLVSWLSG